MQILRWLLKVTNEPTLGNSTGTDPSNTETPSLNQESNKGKEIIQFQNRGQSRGSKKSKLGCTGFKPFAIPCRKDVAKACFYSTISLSRLRCFDRKENWIHGRRMKKEDIARGLGIMGQKADSAAAANAGSKVLPISETTTTLSSSSTSSTYEQGGTSSEKKEKVKSDKAKTMSRMKELLRWAAALKAEKSGKFIGRKVLQFRNRAALKAVLDNEEFSNESPKISFMWEVESCSTISTTYSAISLASSRIDVNTTRLSSDAVLAQRADHCSPRKGNWITTDSEFVVLEL